jgi:hypothetical protein
MVASKKEETSNKPNIDIIESPEIETEVRLINNTPSLPRDISDYIVEIENNKKEILELQTNKESLETFAREKYLMKRDNEDVFVLVEK